MVGLCRLCASLRRMDALVTIRNDSSELCEKLRKCCALDIKMSDPLPKTFCQECIDNLKNSHKFYVKVKEAQETLQALYPSPNTYKKNEQNTAFAQTSIMQTLPVFLDTMDQKTSSVIKQDKQKLNYEDKVIAEISLEQAKPEDDLIEQTTYYVNESETVENIAETSQTRKDFKDSVDMITEKSICCEILQTKEENFDLTRSERKDCLDAEDVNEQLIIKEYVLEQKNSQNSLTEDNVDSDEIINEDDVGSAEGVNEEDMVCNETINEGNIESDEVIKQLNNMITENEIHLEVEYMEYYEDEEEDEELITNIIIEQNVDEKRQTKYLPFLPSNLKVNSWKNYKYLCFVCDNLFHNFIELKTHIELKHKITQMDKYLYKCYDCKKLIPRYNFFLNHIRSKHHNDLKLRCDVCDLSCQNFEELSFHRSVNCKEAKQYAHIVPCAICFKSFHNTFNLQNHCRFQHDSSKTKIKFKCTHCNKEFQYKSCLKTHEQLHTAKKKFSCSYCDKLFYSKLNLEQHLYFHVDKKIYQCNICYKSYKTYQILNEHQKVHTNEKPFKCQFCDKYFGQKVQKVAHERSHTGETPYSCKQCDKRFRHRSALNAHIKIHTGARPYSCEYCAKTFADSSNHKKHVKRMHLTDEIV